MPSSVFLSARRPPTASFVVEADMTQVAIGVAELTWWRSPERLDFVATEVVASGAIADVVAARFDAVAVRRRSEAGVAPLVDWTAIVCASLCKEKPGAASDIVARTGLSRSAAGRSLALAVDHGALMRDGRRFVANGAWESPVRRVVAAELKLRDWQKGLAQAARYLRWADASWLILGATALEPAQEALKDGIGLLRLTPEGKVQKAQFARQRRPTNPLERIWISEQILKQALAGGWRPDVTAPEARFAGAPAFATT